MSVDYSKIKNQKLVKLIQESPALELLPDAMKQRYVDKIIALPDRGEVELLALLEKQAKTLPKLTPEEKIAIFETGTKAMKTMMKNFKKDVRVEGEKIDAKESATEQEKLLGELDKME
ncbi:MAG: hypothetical protein ABH856_02105 [Patescibacteria group bacterium]|nr:hypothetical protein [Patescibacteria group bacterium]